MRFLVTGSNGYLGSHLVSHLREKYPHAFVDTLDLGEDKTPITRERFAFDQEVPIPQHYNVDLAKQHMPFTEYMYDAVFHLAATSTIDDCNGQPFTAMLNNVSMVQNLLDIHINVTPFFRNFIFASSGAVYKWVGDPVYTEASPILDPSSENVYGLSKAIGENLLMNARKEFGIKSVSLRFSNITGQVYPNVENHVPETHIIPKAVRAIRHGQPFYVYGDANQERDYIHVSDVCDALVATYEAMKTKAIYGGINISTNIGISVSSILDMIESEYNKKHLNINRMKTVLVGSRSGDRPKSVLDNSLAKKILNWEPKKSLVDSISSYL